MAEYKPGDHIKVIYEGEIESVDGNFIKVNELWINTIYGNPVIEYTPAPPKEDPVGTIHRWSFNGKLAFMYVHLDSGWYYIGSYSLLDAGSKRSWEHVFICHEDEGWTREVILP